MASSVAIRRVSHRYDTDQGLVEALSDIHVEIEEGEVACIVGRSGCGKSTLLRIAAGLMQPTQGRVEIGGEAINGVTGNVGFVFQNFEETLLKWKTVFDNVAIGAEMRNRKDAIDVKEITNNYLRITNLDDFSENYPQELSGGMKQRVQVARILAYGPDVLLCDEPFGALDAQTKESLQEEFLKILDQEPKTTLFVTHDIEEAIYLGDTVYVFETTNPGTIGNKMPVSLKRPRYPRAVFQQDHSDEVTRMKLEIQESMRA